VYVSVWEKEKGSVVQLEKNESKPREAACGVVKNGES